MFKKNNFLLLALFFLTVTSVQAHCMLRHGARASIMRPAMRVLMRGMAQKTDLDIIKEEKSRVDSEIKQLDDKKYINNIAAMPISICLCAMVATPLLLEHEFKIAAGVIGVSALVEALRRSSNTKLNGKAHELKKEWHQLVEREIKITRSRD